MIEVWHQYTCDGCGGTEWHPHPNAPRSEVRREMAAYGWRPVPGGLDYCRLCVAEGKHRTGRSLFRDEPNPKQENF